MLNTKKLYIVNKIVWLLPMSSCHSLKAKLYRWAGVKIGENVEIFSGVQIIGNGEVEIGDGVFLGHEAMIMVNEGSKVVVEDNCIIGTRTILVTGFHPITTEGERILSREGTSSQIRVCKGATVLTGSVVVPGVTVGKMALVGAGATVVKDVPPYALVGGCPAKFIRDLREPR